MTTPLHWGGFITMPLPFVGDRATTLDGFFSQRETRQKHHSRQRRVSLGVSLKNIEIQITNDNNNLHYEFKCLCTTKY